MSYIKQNLRGLVYLDLSDATLFGATSIDVNITSGIRYLSLPNNITELGGQAESYLETIIIPANVTVISSNFYTSLKEIHCKAANPPTLSSEVWTNDEYDFSHLKIYVPKGSQSRYKTADIWSNFEIIEE